MRSLLTIVFAVTLFWSAPGAAAGNPCDRVCGPTAAANCKRRCPANCTNPADCADCNASCEMRKSDLCRKKCAKAQRLKEQMKGKATPAPAPD